MMTEIKLGIVEAQFADIIWKHAPLTTKELVSLCETELNWKRTTTYTVLKKLCIRGIFALDDGLVTVKISKDKFYSLQCQQFVDETFNGSLPAFIAAFTSCKTLNTKDLEEIIKIMDSLGAGEV